MLKKEINIKNIVAVKRKNKQTNKKNQSQILACHTVDSPLLLKWVILTFWWDNSLLLSSVLQDLGTSGFGLLKTSDTSVFVTIKSVLTHFKYILVGDKAENH